MKVKLTKDGPGKYFYRDYIITRKEWIMPYVYTSWRITKDGVKVDDFDTLRDCREVLAWIDDEN
jgi:hypothetical protein